MLQEQGSIWARMLQALNVCYFDIFLPLLLRSIARHGGFHKFLFEVLVRRTYYMFSAIRFSCSWKKLKFFLGRVHVCEGGSGGRITGVRNLPFLQDK